MSKIRHLRALQAFDSAATHRSLSRAAEELSVTQGAVSRQIKQLEEYLGVKLFKRTSTGVEKTLAGDKLHLMTGQAFTLLEKGLIEFVQPKTNKSLTISLTSSLATKWLVPRLSSFRAQNPQVEIFLDTSDELIDFDISEVDAALRFAIPENNGLFWEQLTAESLIVVASPNLVTDKTLPLTPKEICQLPILVDDFDDRWLDWLAIVGHDVSGNYLKPDMRFKDSTVMISAVINGQGIALARELLVADDLAEGLLVRLDDVQVPLDRSLNFVCRQRDKASPNLVKLRKWLMAIQ
ncbi:LysR substrate-binding domain-containing protein [Aliikangiella coralliicola]|uniref:LysR family transcriptional regulator n=1 Tax=Aliikangiella coralliicola TaxID=2592383 RepID=A0A545UC29_9GAMM|nr:LysR substrate-binding domain-containing protein [Aliikangiella coralliicola]TQV87019.1 LysR family transcriptional regulator [Aliikangiella coralliicola]